MSIASDHAHRVKAAQQRPESFASEGHVIAHVTDGGQLGTAGTYLNPDEALRLAQWIIRTFGEPGKHLGIGQVYDLRSVPVEGEPT